MTVRPYTGVTEGWGGGRRPGTEHFAAAFTYLTSGRMWNNGTYVIRMTTSNSNVRSVHGTGRAVDLDSSKTDRYPGCTLAELATWADVLADRADLFGIEMVIHYAYTGPEGRGGRVWRCDRDAWRYPDLGVLSGGGQTWANHLHVELSPEFADSPSRIDDGFAALLSGVAAPAPTRPRYPGRPLRQVEPGGRPSESVRRIQTRLGIMADGWFGPKTAEAVRQFQRSAGLVVDAVVGPVTWAALFP